MSKARLHAIIFAILLTMGACATSMAAAPAMINYQGYLKQNGVPVHNPGGVSMTFALWDNSAGGAQLCAAETSSVPVNYGRFSYQIGSGTCNLAAVNWQSTSVYLEITVAGTTLTPREQITSAAYALGAVDKSGDTITGALTVNNNITAIGNLVTATGTVSAASAALTGGLSAANATLTGQLSAASATFTNNVQANAFVGDGSMLTNLPVAGGAVAKAGDTMTGALTVNNNITAIGNITTATGTVTAANGTFTMMSAATGTFSSGITLAGSLTAATGTISAANGTFTTALSAQTINATGTLTAGSISTTGNATAAYFFGDGSMLTNLPVAGGAVAKSGDAMTGPLNINYNTATATFFVGNASTGKAVYGQNSGASGFAGFFENTNAANTSSTLYVSSGAATSSVYAANTNAGGTAITGTTSSTGASIFGDNQSSGMGVLGYNFGPGYGVYGQNDGSGFGTYGVSNGSGSAVGARQQSTGNLYSGDHAGASGNLMQLQSGGVDKFIVTKAGDVTAANASFTTAINTATGTFTGSIYTAGNITAATGTITAAAFSGNGAGITGIIASDTTKVLKTGDTMTGVLYADQGLITATGITAATGTVTAANASFTTAINTATGTFTGSIYTAGNITAATGTITAAAFSGNGAGLTGINASDTTKVLKTGDTMTGVLYADQGLITATGITAATGTVTAANASFTTAINTATGTFTGSIYTAGNITAATGTITAAAFSGNGAGLTGVTGALGTDSTKVLKTGDTMTGVLYADQGLITATSITAATGTVTAANGSFTTALNTATGTFTGSVYTAGNITASTGTITAAAFSGNGAGLTGVNASDTTKVLKAGDTMTGSLSISTSASTAALGISNTGTGYTGYFSNNTATATILALNTNAGGYGVYGQNTSDGYGVYGWNSGNAGGYGVYGSSVGTGGVAGYFVTGSATSGKPPLQANSISSFNNLFELQRSSASRLYVDNSGALFASGSLNAPTAILTAGINAATASFSGNATAANLFATGYASATTYYGDGSNLQNIAATDNSKVAKAGDTMTGALIVNNNITATGTVTAATGTFTNLSSVTTPGNINASGTMEVYGKVSIGAPTSLDSLYIEPPNLGGITIYRPTAAVSEAVGVRIGVQSSIRDEIQFFFDNNGGTGSTNNLARFQFNAVPMPVLTMKADNTVGIGTNAPTESLDVVGNIKASGNITAIGNITTATGTVTGATGTFTNLTSVNTPGSINASGSIQVLGNATAAYFFGDGSYLSNITATDNTKVAKTGDTMSGALVVNNNITATGTITGATGTFTTLTSVNTPGSINASGSLQVTGNATAAAFFGDGSALTSVDATLLNGVASSAFATSTHTHTSFANLTISGNATAAYFFGDGSNLTGIVASDTTKVAKTGDTMTGTLIVNNDITATGTITGATGTFTTLTSVNTPGNINASGSLQVTGNATAAAFFGNGSALTSVDATLLNGVASSAFATSTHTHTSFANLTISGNATAAYFFGDGSNLTGINASDTTKVAKSGDTMTGALIVNNDITATGTISAATATITNQLTAASATFTNNVQAAAFFGDGSNLTGISATDNTKVAKTGDTMSGALVVNNNITATGTVTGATGTFTTLTSVNTPGSINASGSLQVTGNATAAAFFGNGAALTNVDATLLNGVASSAFATSTHTHTSFANLTISGNATAAYFFGDGSNLSNISASDTTKVAKVGDTMTGALVVNNNITATGTITAATATITNQLTAASATFTNNVTAAAFYGDGSNLTGISASDTTKVAKTGDTMSGALTVNNNITATGTISAATATITNQLTAASATFTNNVTAAAFYGDGSNLTGINASDTTKVAKTGDTMSGALVVNNDITATGTVTGATGTFTTLTSVNTPGSINASGSLQVTGNATAAAFFGNGTALTNVDATLLNGVASSAFATSTHTHTSFANLTISGNATAAYFFGDGSNLSNISASDTTKVAKSGDTMTGALVVNNDITATGTVTGATGTFTTLTSVNTPGSINASGSLQVTGNATAAAFFGNGAALTNVDATLLNGVASSAFATSTHTHTSFANLTISGNATAAYFFGDGSNLTGINASDTTKVAKSGDTMTGALVVNNNITATGTVTGATGTFTTLTAVNTPGNINASGSLQVTGNATAAAFFGDGSNLTNVYGTDTTKVAKTGDTMTGALVVNNDITATGTVSAATATITNQLSAASATFTNNVTASAFYGDGSNLTGISASDTTKVAKTGDTMTGALIVNNDITATGTVTGATGTFTTLTSVNTPGSINASGSLQVTGNATAAAFFGDGSALTSVDATLLNGVASSAFATSTHTHTSFTNLTISGNATAAYFFGDGSNLTGITASDTTKVAKTGDTMTGALVVNNDITATGTVTGATGTFSTLTTVNTPGNIYASGTVTSATGTFTTLTSVNTPGSINASGSLQVSGNATAAYFFGDGSNLTGIVASDTTKVAKFGDTMTGSLVINANTPAASSTFNVTNNGGGYTASFSNNQATATLFSSNSNATGQAIYGKNTANGNAVFGDSTGAGAGVYGLNNASGSGVYGSNTSTGYGVFGTNNNASGKGVYGSNTSTGQGVYGENLSATTGTAGYFKNSNAGNSSAPLIANTQGSGNLIELQYTGSPRFYVDGSGSVYSSSTVFAATGTFTTMPSVNTTGNVVAAGNITAATGTISAAVASITGNATAANIFATGYASATTYYGDGSNLSNITATDNTKIAKTGDTMTGALVVNNNITATGTVTGATGTFTTLTSVSTPGNINASGSLQVTGNATAAAFFGDGSALTSVDATLLNGVASSAFATSTHTHTSFANLTISGNATAAYFFGDGSNLTNVSASDTTKVAKTGDTMTGALIVNNDITATGTVTGATGTFSTLTSVNTPGNINASGSLQVTGNATAAAFFGDGSNLTNVFGTDTTKVAKSGDTMTGALTVNNNITATGTISAATATITNELSAASATFTNNVQAAAFYGDGSNLTGIITTDNTKVAKTGDTMTGALIVNNDITATGTVTGATGSFTTFTSINTPGNATAAAFFGNGAALTNVDAVTFNGYATSSFATSTHTHTSFANIAITGDATATNLIATGYASATYFYGDGSALTGVNATFLSGLPSTSFATSTHTHTSFASLTITGNATAAYFFGDGSNLTNVSASDTTKVSKAGDTLTGSLSLIASSSTETLFVRNTGSGGTAVFTNANATATLYGENTSTGAGIYGRNLSTGKGVYGENSSTGYGVYGYNTGGGYGVYGDSSSAGGFGVFGRDTNLASGYGLYGQKPGAGYAVFGEQSGTGALYGGNHTGTSGNLIQLQNGGTNIFVVAKDGTLTLNNSITATGTITTAASITAATGTVTAATGSFTVLTAVNTPNSITASGSLQVSGNATAAYFFGDGSNLTNVVASDTTKVAKTGDTMTGALTVNNNITATGTVTGATGSFTVLTAVNTPNNITASGSLQIGGNATAAYFFGDGSNLTNVSATDTSKVAKTGDTMTGALTVNNDITATGTVTAATGSFSILTAVNTPNNITASGSLQIGGNATAAYFFGDGTNVTNVDAALLNGVASSAFATSTHTHTSFANLSITGNATATNLIATGYASATTYYGDGSNLTNVTATDNTKVAKTGDTLTGSIVINANTPAASASFEVNNTGGGWTTHLTNNQATETLLVENSNANGIAVYGQNTGGWHGVVGNTNGSGSAVRGINSGSGVAIAGVTTGTSSGMAAYFKNGNAGNSSATVQIDNTGTGNLIEALKSGSARFYVDNNGNVFATGGLQVSGNATAAYFFGDGSNLTNVSATDSTKLSKSGDVMTGPLSSNYAAPAGSATIFADNTGGGGWTARFVNDQATATLSIEANNAAGVGINARNNGGGNAIAGNSVAGTGSGVRGISSGTGAAVSSASSGTGNAAYFKIGNVANASAALLVETLGTGNIAEFWNTGASRFYIDNTGNAFATGSINAASATLAGQLNAQNASITNEIDAASATFTSNVTAAAFYGNGANLTGIVANDTTKALKTGDLFNGPVQISTNGVSTETLFIYNDSTGTLIQGNQTGTGDFIQMKDNVANMKFAVDVNGNVFASGTYSGNGSNLTGVVKPTGDLFNGPVQISTNGVSTETLYIYNDSTGTLVQGNQFGTGDFIQMKDNVANMKFAVDVNGNVFASGTYSGNGSNLTGVVKPTGDLFNGPVQISTNGVSTETLYIYNDSTGTLVQGNQFGSGDFIQMKDNVANMKFAVDNSGNVFASGTYSGSGSNLTGVVKPTGDLFNGPVQISTNGVSTETLYIYNDSTGTLIQGNQTGTGDFIQMKDNLANMKFAVDVFGNIYASGTLTTAGGGFVSKSGDTINGPTAITSTTATATLSISNTNGGPTGKALEVTSSTDDTAFSVDLYGGINSTSTALFQDTRDLDSSALITAKKINRGVVAYFTNQAANNATPTVYISAQSGQPGTPVLKVENKGAAGTAIQAIGDTSNEATIIAQRNTGFNPVPQPVVNITSSNNIDSQSAALHVKTNGADGAAIFENTYATTGTATVNITTSAITQNGSALAVNTNGSSGAAIVVNAPNSDTALVRVNRPNYNPIATSAVLIEDTTFDNTGSALNVRALGKAPAARFEATDNTSATPTVLIQNNTTDPNAAALKIKVAGNNGVALSAVSDTANAPLVKLETTNNQLYATAVLVIGNDRSDSQSSGIYSFTTGTGAAGVFESYAPGSSTNTLRTILSNGNAGASALKTENYSTNGVAAYFTTNNNVNSTATIQLYTNSTDPNSALIAGDHDGAGGDLIRMRSQGNDRFIVDKNGNIYASGTFVSSAGAPVKTSGDTMTGSLVIGANPATASLDVTNNFGGGQAARFTSHDATATVFIQNDSSGPAIDVFSSSAAYPVASFENTNGAQSKPAIQAITTDTATATIYAVNGSFNTNSTLFGGNHTGGEGTLLSFEANGVKRFNVDRAGNIYASGSLYASDTSLLASAYINFGGSTGLVGYGFRDNNGAIEYKDNGNVWTPLNSLGGGASVLRAGDAMTGSLLINANSSTASLEVNNTSSGVTAHIFGSAASTTTLYVENANAGVGGYGVYSVAQGSNGAAVYGKNIGTSNAGYFTNSSGGNATATLVTETAGSGNLIESRKNSVAKFIVGNSGDIYSSGTLFASSTDIGFNGYVNFGPTTATTGYGFRDNAGIIQYKDSAGSWISFNSISGGGNFVSKLGDIMSGPLTMTGAGVSTATLDVTNSSSNAGRFSAAGASTATVYIESTNAGVGGTALFAQSQGTTFGYAVYGSNTNGGVAGYFTNSAAGNSTATLITETAGSGNLIESRKNSVAKFIVGNSGDIYSSGTLFASSTDIGFNGYVNFGPTTATTGYGFRDNGGIIQYKDGAGSWISLSSMGGAANAVSKLGDTMTGPLSINFNTATNSFEVINIAGGGSAAHFKTSNASPTVFVESNSGSFALHAYNNGSGSAGEFQIDNPGDASTALDTRTNGTGDAFWAFNNGMGRAGRFMISNAGNTFPPLEADTTGTGDLFKLTRSAVPKFIVDNNGNVFASGTITGSGGAPVSKSGDIMSGPLTMLGSGVSTATLDVTNSSSNAGKFSASGASTATMYIESTNAGVGGTALFAQAQGTTGGFAVYGKNINSGVAAYFSNSAVGNATATLITETAGSGNLIESRKNSQPKFIVDNNGNIFASGTFTGSGGAPVSKSGDTMNGPLTINANTSTATFFVANTSGGGLAAKISNTNATASLLVENTGTVAGSSGIIVTNTVNVVNGGHAGSFTNSGINNDRSTIYAFTPAATATIFAANSNPGSNPNAALYGGNLSIPSGSLITLNTNNQPKFIVDNAGTVYASGPVIAGCPMNTVSAGDFCISNASMAGNQYGQAVQTCRTTGMHLCSGAETLAGCAAGGIGWNDVTTYWVSDFSSTAANALSMNITAANCAAGANPSTAGAAMTTAYPFYCCIGK